MLANNINRLGLSLIFAAASLAAPLGAQKAGTVEIGGFGRYTWFDNSLPIRKNQTGAGGRLGVFVLPNLAIEGDASYTVLSVIGAPHGGFLPITGRLVYNAPASDRVAVLLGAGYVYQKYLQEFRDLPQTGDWDAGANGLLGLRVRLSDVLSLRGEGVLNWILEPVNKRVAEDNKNWGAQLGLSAQFPKARRDEDNDGVVDRDDRCPGTPVGELVDARGCPRDSDGDGVVDSMDRCPSTPQREIVDANGCPRDSDGDGVTDARDQCPNTARGDAVDASGCARDADGDGVADSRDRCPNTPQGTAVDNNGCARDRDNDGVPDSADRCPNTPEGATVDADGCPLDGDNDGVPNGLDRCPNTSAGTEVDAVGCPILFEDEQTTLVLEGVTFATGSATLTQNAQTILDRVAQSLNGNPDVRVEIGGHTDATGSRTLNINLSQSRADAVRTYLVQRGVAMNRLATRGYGPDNPIASNQTASGRAQNRRVELRRIN